jgi:hypothetical protein
MLPVDSNPRVELPGEVELPMELELPLAPAA